MDNIDVTWERWDHIVTTHTQTRSRAIRERSRRDHNETWWEMEMDEVDTMGRNCVNEGAVGEIGCVLV